MPLLLRQVPPAAVVVPRPARCSGGARRASPKHMRRLPLSLQPPAPSLPGRPAAAGGRLPTCTQPGSDGTSGVAGAGRSAAWRQEGSGGGDGAGGRRLRARKCGTHAGPAFNAKHLLLVAAAAGPAAPFAGFPSAPLHTPLTEGRLRRRPHPARRCSGCGGTLGDGTSRRGRNLR